MSRVWGNPRPGPFVNCRAVYAAARGGVAVGVTVIDQILAVKKFFEQGVGIIASKGHDYAPKGIAMSEVFWTAAESHQTPEQVIYTMMRKHWGAVQQHVGGKNLLAESLHDHLIDIANFCAMLDWIITNRVEFRAELITIVDQGDCTCTIDAPHLCPRCVMFDWLFPAINPLTQSRLPGV